MSATFSLFERWKAAKGYATDSAAADGLGVTRAAVSLWRQGRNGNAALVERMAKDLGEDPVPVILQAFAEAARDAEDRKTLGRLARKLGAACLALFVLAPMLSNSANAATRPGLSANPVYTLCAMVQAWIAGLSRSVSLARARWLTPTEPPQCSLFASNPATP